MKLTGKVCIANLLITMAFSTNLLAQELYTAKGYWTELNKEGYQKILKKQTQGDVLTEEETYFLQDYQDYLKRYYDRMSEDEKLKFVQMQAQWDSQTNAPADQAPEDFNLRTRDRLVNGLYGAYYGASLVAIFESESAGVIAGVPLIMAGVWQLGPVINKKKYEDISLATIPCREFW
jgi:CRISPR/Cas system CMR subunit Cmr6 (Cas7 group RAMP superfamily)